MELFLASGAMLFNIIEDPYDSKQFFSCGRINGVLPMKTVQNGCAQKKQTTVWH